MNEVLKKLEENLKNETVVVAVSGGPDSMALLYLVNSLKEKLNLKIVCAHVNHQVRKESDEEAAMVRHYCEENGIFFEYMTIGSYNKTNFHQDARIKRYDFFEKCVNKCQAKHLLTAHHGDDLIETILMRIVRGATFKSYAGFHEKIKKDTYTILRPLITVTKQELENFDIQNNIPYCIDESNKKDTYTRNRFRKYILPKLKEENKNVHQKFYKFSKTLEMYDDYIEKETTTVYKKIYTNHKLDISKFKQLEKVIQLRIINKILWEVYQQDLSLITDNHRSLLYQIIMNNKASSEISLPKHKKAIKSYNCFYITQEKQPTSYQIELVDYLTLPNGKTLEVVDKSDDNSNYTTRLLSTELHLPLYIRTRKEGDKIAIKGLNGTKKVKDIFINEKITKQERENFPILVDSKENILWLPGLKKSKFHKQKNENYDIILKYH